MNINIMCRFTVPIELPESAIELSESVIELSESSGTLGNGTGKLPSSPSRSVVLMQ